MFRAVVVGEKHLILGFRALGFEIVPLEDSSKLMQELIGISTNAEIGLVFVTESLAIKNPKAIEEFRQRCHTVLTVIPTHEGSKHISFQEIRQSVENSLGVDILGKVKK